MTKNKTIVASVSLLLLSIVLVGQFFSDTQNARTTTLANTGEIIQPNVQSNHLFAYTINLERSGFVNSSFFRSKTINDNVVKVNNNINGKLNLKLINKINDTSLFFGQFSRLKNTKDLPVDTTVFPTKPFAFYHHNNGALTLDENNIYDDNNSKSMILQVLSYLQLVGLNASLAQWQTKETDLIGNYTAQYSATNSKDTISVKKHKLNYVHVNPLPALFNGNVNDIQANIVNHHSTFTLNKSSQWPDKIEVTEQIKMESGKRIISDLPIIFSAFISTFDMDITFPHSLIELNELLAKSDAEINDYYGVNNRLSALTVDKTPNEILSYYLEVYKDSPSQASNILINYLRKNPQWSNDFVDSLYANRKQLTDREEVRLWALLAKVGHKEAQTAYIYALTNPDFEQIIQYRAIAHIRFFEQPSAEFIDNLWQVQANLYQAVSGNVQGNKTLASATLFAIGTLTTSKQIDENIKQNILSTLEEKLQNENDDSKTSALIIAAGNTHNIALLDSITPYLEADNDQLKAKAFIALARMPSEQALDSFTQAYEKLKPASQQLQFIALDNLNKMSMTNESIKWVADKALQKNNYTETTGLIRVLGNNISTFPMAETALRELLNSQPSIEIKSEIYRYISP
ncbi:MAG: hypothetical protein HRT51_06820 [Colwellia sp.]|nr:hypothetical protein [Colwellia sp.]